MSPAPDPESPPRLAWPPRWAWAGAAIILTLHAWADPTALEYRRGLFASEAWRLISGHWVHLSWLHALADAAGLLLVAALFFPRLSSAMASGLIFALQIAISGALYLLWPELEWYRGFSGVLYALLGAGAISWLAAPESATRSRWLALALLALFSIKLIQDRAWQANWPRLDWLDGPLAPQAHLAGIALGLAAGLGYAALAWRESRQQA